MRRVFALLFASFPRNFLFTIDTMSRNETNHDRIDSHLRVDPAVEEHPHPQSPHIEHTHPHFTHAVAQVIGTAKSKVVAGICGVGAEFDFPNENVPMKINDLRLLLQKQGGEHVS